MRSDYPAEVIESLERKGREIVEIKPFVTAYNREVREFYSWLASQQSAMHGLAPGWDEVARTYARMSLLPAEGIGGQDVR
jgi:hypothetical protein